MTLRIVFTREDLQHVRISDAPDPMWELVQSLHQLQERRPAPRYSKWHRQVRKRIAGHDGARSVLGLLCTLVPLEGAFPDFLTPAPFDARCGRPPDQSPRSRAARRRGPGILSNSRGASTRVVHSRLGSPNQHFTPLP
jgi:hypothetical protein